MTYIMCEWWWNGPDIVYGRTEWTGQLAWSSVQCARA